jgi:uncharacterized protein YerC
MAPEELRADYLSGRGKDMLHTLEQALDGREARAAMLAIIESFGRQSLYIPERSAVERRFYHDVAETMLEDGARVSHIMAETGLSQRTIERIKTTLEDRPCSTSAESR